MYTSEAMAEAINRLRPLSREELYEELLRRVVLEILAATKSHPLYPEKLQDSSREGVEL